jgi:hypothetical protein
MRDYVRPHLSELGAQLYGAPAGTLGNSVICLMNPDAPRELSSRVPGEVDP